MATVTRWDPFQDVLSLREAMNQLMEESFVRPTAAQGGKNFVPALDLSETAEGYLVEAALPGVKPEDVEITVENNVLTIKGETRQETDEQAAQLPPGRAALRLVPAHDRPADHRQGRCDPGLADQRRAAAGDPQGRGGQAAQDQRECRREQGDRGWPEQLISALRHDDKRQG